MSNIITLKDLDANQVYVPREDHENKIKKMKSLCVSLKDMLLKEKQDKFKLNIDYETVKRGFIKKTQTERKLEQKIKELEKNIYDLTNRPIPKIRIPSLNDDDNIFKSINKALYDELNFSPMEVKRMQEKADRELLALENSVNN